MIQFGGLRIERSKNLSEPIIGKSKIMLLKENNYIIEDTTLDGEAPKQMARIYFYEKGGRIRKSRPKSWDRYIIKSSEKWYPIESVTEYMINRIGQVLEVNMNQIRLIRAKGQIRFLSKYFLQKNQTLNHGAEICGEYLGDYDMAQEIADDKKDARELFTYDFIKEAISFVFPKNFKNILSDLVAMIIFDALVGNNDRHFYNWGVISSSIKSGLKPKFSPVYDSARGLFWNIHESNLNKYLDDDLKMQKYLENSCPRISIPTNPMANHFDLVAYVIKGRSDYRKIKEKLCSIEAEKNVLAMLEEELFHLLNVKRRQAIRKVLQLRFERIRTL